MDCARFEQTIDLVSSGRAAPALRSAAGLHLKACVRCRRLYGGYPPREDAGEMPDLARSILESTSGPACGAVTEILCCSFDHEDNDEARKSLVRMHLASCGGCRDISAAMEILRIVLPRLATCEPGEEFTAAVIAASRAVARRPRPFSNLGQLWQRLVSRPLFAWEAAYVGTLLFALTFLNPVLPVGGVTLRAITAAHNSAASRLLPAQEAVSGLAHDFGDEVATSGSVFGAGVRQWSSRTVTRVLDTARELRGRFQRGPAPHNRTFLRWMRLPGCEITTDDHNPGDHV